MPEGHTIHRLARDQRRDLAGHPVAAWSPQGRFGVGAADLDGRILLGTEARGKHLFHHYEGDRILYVHLGLIGKFHRGRVDEPARLGEVRLSLEGGAARWDLTGPMRCDLVTPPEHDQIVSDLGPDPLRRGARAADFVARLRRKRAPVAAALLDQTVIAGIGNVYRAELLFLRGIHPIRPAAGLDEDEARALWDEAAAQLRQGLRLNRIVTISAVDRCGDPAGRVPPGERLYVYQRAGLPCRRCGTPIEQALIGARKVWWCPVCQPQRA
jgi:endonuclease-8